MRSGKPLIVGAMVALAVIAGLVMAGSSAPNPEPAEASFHRNRIYAFMGGFNGDETVQYVELRMAAGSQNFVAGKVLCFFGPDGSPWARFKFPADVGNGAEGSSTLVGSAAFDAAWAAGSPDAVFLPGNTTAIAFDASNTEPVPFPAGYIGFGTDSTTQPSEMCLAGYSEIDSVAYGTAYTGGVNFGSKLASDLPTNSFTAIGLIGDLCNPCARDNSTDYGVIDTNEAPYRPRNNSGNQGPLTPAGPTPTPGPTETPGPTQTPGPTETPGGKAIFGDNDCDGDVDPVDGLGDLRNVAGLSALPQHEPCPDIGSPDGGRLFGDLGCDGAIDAVDGLRDLRFVAGLPALNAPPGCPQVGTHA